MANIYLLCLLRRQIHFAMYVLLFTQIILWNCHVSQLLSCGVHHKNLLLQAIGEVLISIYASIFYIFSKDLY